MTENGSKRKKVATESHEKGPGQMITEWAEQI